MEKTFRDMGISDADTLSFHASLESDFKEVGAYYGFKDSDDYLSS